MSICRLGKGGSSLSVEVGASRAFAPKPKKPFFMLAIPPDQVRVCQSTVAVIGLLMTPPRGSEYPMVPGGDEILASVGRVGADSCRC